jgi:hypothetical protein
MQTNPNMHSIFWKLWRGCSPFAHSWLRSCKWLIVISIFTEIPLSSVPSNLMFHRFHSHLVSFNIITIFQAIDLVWIMSFANKIYIRVYIQLWHHFYLRKFSSILIFCFFASIFSSGLGPKASKYYSVFCKTLEWKFNNAYKNFS